MKLEKGDEIADDEGMWWTIIDDLKVTDEGKYYYPVMSGIFVSAYFVDEEETQE